MRTYTVSVNVTLSIDEAVIKRARKKAEKLGTSVNQLIRDYLEEFSGSTDREADAAEIEKLSRSSRGDSRGWKFDREELHKRR